MHRSTVRLVARLAAAALAATALVAVAAPGTSGGLVNPGIFAVPAGATVTFGSPKLAGCNSLEWGYQIDEQTPVVVNKGANDCVVPSTFPDTTIGPFTSDVELRVFLHDISCAATFGSDGLPYDHVSISGTGPWSLGIADAGGICEKKTVDFTDFDPENGNLSLTVSIDPVLTVKKVVTGDDPGIAFPITVACTAEGRIPAAVGAAASPDIVLGEPGAVDTAEVSLANGQSADIPVTIDDVHIDSVTCTVSESLAGVTLPAGYTCAAPVVDHPEVVWDESGWSARPVTVTNSCTKAVEVQPTFTG